MTHFKKIFSFAALFAIFSFSQLQSQTVGTNLQIGDFVYKITSNVYPNFEVAFCGYYWNAQGGGTNSITVPSSITYNGDEYSVTSLLACNLTSNSEARISYTIPNTIKTIQPDAVNGVRKIILEDGNQNYILQDGLLMNSSKDTIFACEVGQVTDAKYSLTVPQSVKVIATAAFRLCDKIETIKLPSSLTHIMGYSFQGCAFKSCTMQEGITYIGTSAFRSCKNLEQITIPKSVSGLGDAIFSGCDSLKTMYYNAINAIHTENNHGIMLAGNLDEVIVGNEVQSLPERIFDGCPKITKINFPESLRSIGEWAFKGCNRITTLEFPDSLESIGWGAFSGVVSVKEITIPKGLKYLAHNSFENTTSLTTVHFNAKHCNVNIGDAYNHSTDWTNVTTATIGDDVEIIPGYLFANCRGLKTITIPASVDTIGPYPFLGCDSLETVYYNPKNAVYDVYGEGIAKNGKIQQFIIGDNVQSIPQCLLNQENGISEIALPASVKSIGRNAFANCGNLQSAPLPDDLTYIGNGAFYSTAISELTIPKNVTYIGTNAFAYCMNLTNVHYNAINADYVWDGNSIQGMFAGDTNLTDVTIGSDVETIPHCFLKDNKKVTDFTLPDKMKYIGCYAFSNTNIKEIRISDIVNTIGQQAFDNCDSLKIIDYNSPACAKQGATYYGDGIFKNCHNIQRLTIGDNVISLPNWLFAYCDMDTIYSYPIVAPSIVSTGSFHEGSAAWIGVPCVAYDDYYSKWIYSVNELHRLGDASYTAIEKTICEGEQYEFNGEKLTQSGEYIANLVNKYECDSIVTLNLTVNPIYDTLIEAAIISGETYSLNGFSKQSEGSYIQQLQTVNGCDSVIRLNLTTIKTDTVTLHDTIINTLYDTVTLHDTIINTLYDTVTLHDTITNTLYDTVTLHDTIINTLYDTVTLHDTIATTLYDTVTLFDTITLTEYIHDTITDTDTIYVTDTVTPCAKVYTYVYATINNGETYEGYGFSESEAGTYTQTLQTEDGCDSIVTLHLQINSGLEQIIQEEIFSLYPNPAKGNVTIEGSGDVVIFNTKGQIVKTLKNINGSVAIDIADFESGIYYVKVNDVTKKLIVK